MSGRQPEKPKEPERAVKDRWRALYDWAVAHTAGREGWDPTDLLGVMQGCKIAGAEYEELAPVLWRLAWTGDDHQDYAELRQLARVSARPGGQQPGAYERGGELGRELLANRPNPEQCDAGEAGGGTTEREG